MNILLIIFLGGILIPIAWGSFLFAPWLPTRKNDLKRIIQLANLQSDSVFADLGAGTGTVMLSIAKKTNAKVIGYEISPLFFLITRLRIKRHKSRAQVKWRDFLRVNLSEFDVIYLFGTPKGLQRKLEEKIWNECRPGTKILSYAFTFANHEPSVISKPSDRDLSIYCYTI